MRWMLDFIRPPEDADWKTVNRWRWNVFLSILGLMGMMVYGEFRQSTFASEAIIDKKITDAQAPLVAAQKKTDSKVDRMSALLTEQLANSKAAEIRLNISKRCKTTGAIEREELNREKDRLQEEYELIKGRRYIEPQCSEL